MQVRDRIYVGGAWVLSAASETLEVVDPSSEQVIGRVPAGTAEDVDRAVAAARAAFPAWSATSAQERAGHLGKLRETLDACATEMAATITAEMGAPPKIARNVQVGTPLRVLRAYADLLSSYSFEEQVGNSLVVREPVGVVGAITPWNYPLHQVVAKLAAALAAGCTVVLKPSESAPLSAYLLFELVDSIGLPPGVVNLVMGTGPVVGERLAAQPDVDMVTFTGSTRAGRRVAAVAAGTVKRVALELGGKSAGVLLPDADLSSAVPAVVRNALLNSGQTCTALTRLLVDRQRYDDAVAVAAQTAEAMTPKLGPLASRAQYMRVQGYIEKGLAEGARVATGGLGRPQGVELGFFARPTVFADVRPDMTVAQEEIFGPVLCVLAYSDEDDAVEIANGTPYGLAGGVWSADEQHALAFARRLRTGQVDVNGGAFNPAAPFGGYKQSGVGRELGRYGLEEFLEVKSIQLPPPSSMTPVLASEPPWPMAHGHSDARTRVAGATLAAMRVYLGSDHAGYELKSHLLAWLEEKGHEPVDCGPVDYDPDDDYPPFVLRAAKHVAGDRDAFGIVIGGSGNGEAIAANKVKGVRAALAWSDETATLAREHNDANVISVGARMHTLAEVTRFVELFLATPSSGADRHSRRIVMISSYEQTGQLPPLPGEAGVLTDELPVQPGAGH